MNNQGHADILRLFERLRREQGDAAKKIIDTIIAEIGGMRLTIPDLKDLWRIERNRRIRKQFDGANIEELSIRFNLDKRHIRRIVQDK